MILRLVSSLLIFAALGCGEQRANSVKSPSYASQALGPTTADSGGKVQIVEVYGGGTAKSEPRDRAPIVDPIQNGQDKTVSRKILYSADIAIVVEDFPKATDELVALIRKVGGYVADNDVTGSPGRNRFATWKVRVPVAQFDAFLDSVTKLGELQRKRLNSQDVTEEFFDLETRIKNKKIEEARLVKHLTDSTGKLEDILAVEREISRVREEIERMEGRIRLLANLAELTTVSITAHERTGFVPATSPTFATRAARTFAGSARSLVQTVQYLALQAISVVPWLPFWFVVGAVIWLFFRRRRRRFAVQPTTTRPVAP